MTAFIARTDIRHTLLVAVSSFSLHRSNKTSVNAPTYDATYFVTQTKFKHFNFAVTFQCRTQMLQMSAASIVNSHARFQSAHR